MGPNQSAAGSSSAQPGHQGRLRWIAPGVGGSQGVQPRPILDFQGVKLPIRFNHLAFLNRKPAVFSGCLVFSKDDPWKEWNLPLLGGLASLWEALVV